MSSEVATFHLEGVTEFKASVDALTDQLDAATKAGTAAQAAWLEGDIKDKLKLSAHSRGTKTPSEPGDPPSTVDGTLARSVIVDGPEMVGFGNYVAAVGADGVVYSRIQELGGVTGKDHKTTLPARPYTLNTLEEDEDDLLRIAESFWGAVIEGS